jgi:type IV fimbrial biogenesis protein FimT
MEPSQPRRCTREMHPGIGRIRGLTLIELLIALSMVAILLGIAVPAFSSASEATHSMQARTALMGSYLAALNGAAIANSHAILCPSSDGIDCTDGIDWSRGWIVFVDANGDREHQSGEPILARQGALSGTVHLHSTVDRTRIEIQADGSVAGSNVTFTLCDGRGAAQAESLVLSNKSNLSVGTPTAEAVAATCAH